LVRSALAIYITLFAITSVVIAQILYWRLVISRHGAADAAREVTDMGGPLEPVEPVEPWAGLEADALAPVLVSEPVPALEPMRVREPLLSGA
jgi:hypothetical protein